MRRLPPFLLFFLLLLPQLGLAAPTVLVRTWPNSVYAFSKDAGTRWATNDFICFRELSGRSEDPKPYIACGQVLRVTQRGLIVNLTGSDVALKLGTRLDMARVDAETFRELGYVPPKFRDPIAPFDQRTIGLGVTLNSPFLQYMQGITRNFSVGLMSQILSREVGQGSVNGLSNQILAHYFHNKLFHGPWATAGIGWFIYRASRAGFGNRSTNSLNVYGSVGWRHLFDNNINIGAALGIHYFFKPNPPTFDLGWKGVMPIALLEVAYRF